MNITIVGNINRSELIQFGDNAISAQYVECNNFNEICMLYKQEKIDPYIIDSPLCWVYYSLCGYWKSSYIDLNNKKLFKVID